MNQDVVEEPRLNAEAEARRRQYATKALQQHFGPKTWAALLDPDISEISVKEDGAVIAARFDNESFVENSEALSPEAIEALIRGVAEILGVEPKNARGIIDGPLPVGEMRFIGLLEPSPAFSIRKRPTHRPTLADMVSDGRITNDQAAFLSAAVKDNKTIIVTGGGATGKTQLLNALLGVITEARPNVRLALIQDTQELVCASTNTILMRTSEEMSAPALVRSAKMFTYLEYLCIGEIRGAEAAGFLRRPLEIGGLATLHAPTIDKAVDRLVALAQEDSGQFPDSSWLNQIAQAVDVIVCMNRTPKQGNGWRWHVESITTVGDYDTGTQRPLITKV